MAAFVLLLAVLGISVAGPLVRLSAADPLAIAVWRLGGSVAIVALILGVNGEWRQWRTLSRRDLLLAVTAGVCLAVHFWSWMASVGMTSIAASAVLVNLHPVVVAVGSAFWLGERPTRAHIIGISVALAGAAVLAWGDAAAGYAAAPMTATLPSISGGLAGSRALAGDALALLGACTVALYLLAGRRLRQTLDLWPYVGLVYGSCFVVLWCCAVVRDVPLTGYASREYVLFAAMVIGPMMLGHTGFNWALRHLPAYVVSLASLTEPIGATLLAATLPGIREMPAPLTLLGGAIILGGILLTSD